MHKQKCVGYSIKVVHLFAAVLAICLMAGTPSAAEVAISNLPTALNARQGVLQDGAPRTSNGKELNLVVSDVPEPLKNLPYVTIKRGDSTQPMPSYSFSVDRDVVVYLFVQKRGQLQESPLGWQRTNGTASFGGGMGDYKDVIFVKEFDKGRVEIPGHEGKNSSGFYALPNLAVVATKEDAALVASKIMPFHKSGMREAEGQGFHLTNLPHERKALVKKLTANAVRTVASYPILLKEPPAPLKGLDYVTVSRGDEGEPAQPYSFTVDKPVWIYLYVQDRGKPGIPSDWQDTGVKGGSHFGKEFIYMKQFPAGEVTIPGHQGTSGKYYGVPNLAAISLKPIALEKTALQSKPSNDTQTPGTIHGKNVSFSDLPRELSPYVGQIKLGAPRAAEMKGFILKKLPKHLEGLDYVTIRRGSGTEPAPAYSFSVNRPVTVYLFVHQRGEPSLPAGWEKTDMEAMSEHGVKDMIYKRDFSAGKIEIPGHDQKAGDFYAVPNLAVVASRK